MMRGFGCLGSEHAHGSRSGSLSLSLSLSLDYSSRKQAVEWDVTASTSPINFAQQIRCLDAARSLYPEHETTYMSCDIHTHTPAQKSYANFMLYPFVV